MDEKNVAEFVNEYMRNHPKSEPRDLYKLLYQAFMGPCHMLEDIFHAKTSLESEFEAAAPIEGQVFEALLPDSGLVRVNLRAFKAADGDLCQLWNAVKLTLKLFQPKPDEFRNAWRAVSRHLRIADYGLAELDLLDDSAEQDPPQSAHHSEQFRHSENPSYRVVAVKAIEGIGGDIFRLFREETEITLDRAGLPDVAIDKPEHEIAIDRVGIEELLYPIVVLDKNNRKQSTVAKVRMSVDLPARWRGTHMSRFVEIINRFRGEITYVQLREILDTIITQFDARSAHITLEFPYFIEKLAPVSKTPSLMQYTAVFDGIIEDGEYRFMLGVEVPVTTLCPCSKELCESSAHSQRTKISIEVISSDFVWIEELVEIAESSASAPLFAMLKREDEKFVTDLAYANPRFVEDVVRAVAEKLGARGDILSYDVRASSEESIHNHSAFARIARKQ